MEFKEKNPIINADEAFKLTKDNRLSFEECMKFIIESARQGNSFTIVFGEINNDAMDKLMDMGYVFGTVTDNMGIKNFKISWKQ